MHVVARIARLLRRGPLAVARRAYQALFPRARCFALVRPLISGRGIEIGGPSEIFENGRALPVYPLISSLEQITFSGDAAQSVALDRPDASYDVVLSSHMLEHTTNPLKAIAEWRRVLKPSGYLLLVVPDGCETFDHARPVTSLEHLIEDFRNDTPESDLAHLAEVLLLQDRKHWSFPTEAIQWDAIYSDNAALRCLHHHVFSEESASALVGLAGFRVLASERVFPFHVVVFAAAISASVLTVPTGKSGRTGDTA